jgi:hypothetical protein
LYHRKDFHGEKINIYECSYCQYASQYSGKVERHTLSRHKIEVNNSRKFIHIYIYIYIYIIKLINDDDVMERILSYIS